MGAACVLFRILFLVLIARSLLLLALAAEQQPAAEAAGSSVANVRHLDPKQLLSETAELVDHEAPSSTPSMQDERVEDAQDALHLKSTVQAASGATSTSTTTTTTIMPSKMSNEEEAELCYLSNGGSSLTLTVNEATQVGANIGTIEVSLLFPASFALLACLCVCVCVESVVRASQVAGVEIKSRRRDNNNAGVHLRDRASCV